MEGHFDNKIVMLEGILTENYLLVNIILVHESTAYVNLSYTVVELGKVLTYGSLISSIQIALCTNSDTSSLTS